MKSKSITAVEVLLVFAFLVALCVIAVKAAHAALEAHGNAAVVLIGLGLAAIGLVTSGFWRS